MKFRRGLMLGIAGVAAFAPIAWMSMSGRSVTAAPAGSPAASSAGDMARIQQYLQTHCVECHGEKTKKADLALHTFKDEASILKAAKAWEGVVEQVQEGEMPPKKKPRPPMGDTEAFLKSVHSVFERAHATGKVDPGHVTVRRLNRTEYNSTIRDLVGVDFQPAEDFPSDDVGHGFDNIGEVLTISPVLMERYLAAAESIMQRAILADPPAKPPTKWQGAKYLEPAGRDVPDKEFRPITKGNLNTPWDLNIDGEYMFKVRAYSKSPDNTPAKVTLTIDGNEVEKFEIPAYVEKQGQQFNEQRAAKDYEFKITAAKGKRRFAINLTNESPADVAKDQRRTLVIHHFSLVGPLDPRPASQKKLLAVDENLPKAEQTRQVLKRFMDRAYRRPVTKDEVDRVVKLADQQESAGQKWEAAIQFAMQAVLVSPKFLFRLELDSKPAGEVRQLDEYQLACRLSYFLWSTMPDDELFDLAAKKQLTPNLEAQVRRMLKDPKSEALVDNFAMQWLQLRRLKIVQPDRTLFRGFDDGLRESMMTETRMFIDSIIKEDRSILDMIDSDYTFLDDRLARHYGIADTNGNWMYQKPDRPRGEQIPRGKFVRVTLPANGQRGGLLGQASILTVTSNPTRTSPVKRGKFVLEQILGTPPPPAPPNVPELKVEQGQLTGTLRQKMEQHRADPNCANCHAKLDPPGFAFENFDAVGAWRTKEGGSEIDASGEMGDKTFKGAKELRALLKEKKGQFAKCLTEKMMIYALGRGLEYYDRPTLNKITTSVDQQGYKFSSLVVEIVKSDPFRLTK